MLVPGWGHLPRRRSAVLSVVLVPVIVLAGIGVVLGDVVPGLWGMGYVGMFLSALIGAGTVVIPTFALPLAFVMGGLPAYAPLVIGVVAGIGETIGEMPAYTVGRGGQRGLEAVRGFSWVEARVQRWGAWTIFVASLLPNPLVKLSTVAAGAAEMPLRWFLLAAMSGKVIKFTVVAWLGSIGVALVAEWLGIGSGSLPGPPAG